MHLYTLVYRFSHNYQKVDNTPISMDGYVTKYVYMYRLAIMASV